MQIRQTKLTVGVVWVGGERVSEEQGAVQGLGLGDLHGLGMLARFYQRLFLAVRAYRARRAEVLREGLAGLHSCEGTRGAAVVGV